jgi:uncharacterized membrane protein
MINLINTAHAGVISDAPTIGTLLGNVLGFLLQIAGIFGIISLVVSGVMIFLSAGDAERSKKAKQAATYSVIGIAVVLGGLILVRTINGAL